VWFGLCEALFSGQFGRLLKVFFVFGLFVNESAYSSKKKKKCITERWWVQMKKDRLTNHYTYVCFRPIRKRRY
jgi:hypothetical protein